MRNVLPCESRTARQLDINYLSSENKVEDIADKFDN